MIIKILIIAVAVVVAVVLGLTLLGLIGIVRRQIQAEADREDQPAPTEDRDDNRY